MKWFIVCCILLVFLFGCTGKTIRLNEQSAKVGIHEWEMTPTNDAWIVAIWYDIENTGTLDITRCGIHVTIDVEGNKTVTADCWGPSKTADEYRAKKVGAPIPPGKTERCVIVLDIPYKPMRVAIELAEFK
jgi:hypothetical protein